MANSGANLALLDLSVDRQQETKAACEKFQGVKVEAYSCDITNVQAVRDTFAAITNTLGPVDILVNNAGVAYGKLAFQETFEQFWKAIEVNFKGSMACIYEVLPGMRERKSGCIISMASRAATVDMAGGLSYNSSKAAIARATSTLQEEFEVEGFGDKLHTYCLHPGAVWGALVTGKYLRHGPSPCFISLFGPTYGLLNPVRERKMMLTDLLSDTIENTTPEVQEQIKPIFKDVPELCANTVTYLASGRAKALRGHYFDCRHDIERVCSFGHETLEKEGLYTLGVKFLPGYENEP